MPNDDDPGAPAILYLHGNNGNIGGKNLIRTHRLHEMGYQVLLVDCRGFGKSFDTATPSEDKVYEDAEAAWNYLTSETDEGGLGFKEEMTFIYGHSLGGAIAIDLASKKGAGAAGLITHSTFTNTLAMSKLKYNGCVRRPASGQTTQLTSFDLNPARHARAPSRHAPRPEKGDFAIPSHGTNNGRELVRSHGKMHSSGHIPALDGLVSTTPRVSPCKHHDPRRKVPNATVGALGARSEGRPEPKPWES